ncbi:MAG: alpha-ribazole phosphatase [Dethiobacteria bacterium]
MEIYLIRHGETESNLQRRYQGWTESPLSDNGLRQAEKVGFFLAEKNIEALYCSDLNRALHTARVIGAGSGIKPQITPLLREIHFGQWEGMTFDEIEAAWGAMISEWIDDPFHKAAPGGETLKEVCERMQSFLIRMQEIYPDGKRIAVVSHGGSIRALLYSVLGLDTKSFWELKIDNASVSLIRLEGGRFKVVYYNRNHHLEEDEYKELNSNVD